MILVDSHEDLAWNILTFGRDYTQSAAETRQREAGSEVPAHNVDSLLGYTDYQRGQVALIFSTLFAAPVRLREGPWDTQFYLDANHARILYRAQLDLYRRLVDDHPDKFRLVGSGKDLQTILEEWEREAPKQESAEEAQEKESSAARRKKRRPAPIARATSGSSRRTPRVSQTGPQPVQVHRFVNVQTCASLRSNVADHDFAPVYSSKTSENPAAAGPATRCSSGPVSREI